MELFSLVGILITGMNFNVDDDGAVAASADFTIKRWRLDQCVQTYSGHTDVVRDLVCLIILCFCLYSLVATELQATVSDTMFLSASNDRFAGSITNDSTFDAMNRSSIRLWDLEGAVLKEWRGHSSYVYSLCTFNVSEFASVGEDGCIKLWSLGLISWHFIAARDYYFYFL